MKMLPHYLFAVFIILFPFNLLAQNSGLYKDFRTSNSRLINTRSNHVDTDLLLRLMEARQQQIAKGEEEDKRKALAAMKQVKSYYSSFRNLPKTVSDGWHNVMATDNDEFCEERKVLVSGNKVIKYVVNNWLEREVSFSGQVNEGKTLIKLKIDDEIGLLDIYFIEYISDPSLRTTAPQRPGSISFWTSWKKASDIKLYFSDVNVGTFASYFSQGTPGCGQEGTITITFKPGTYSFKAESEDVEWKGEVTIYEDRCTLQGISKK